MTYSTRQIYLAFLGIPVVLQINRFVHIEYFGGQLFYDAREVWIPVARSVLRGEQLYLAAWDNKPPLFEYLNVLVMATGHYQIVFFALVALANGTAAILLRRWASEFVGDGGATAAGVLFLASLPVITATYINVRSFSLVFLFAGLLATSAWKKGVAVATAGLFCQFAVFAIPAIVLHQAASRSDVRSWLVTFCASGIAVVVLAYASVAVIWGVDALVAAVESSVLYSWKYVTQRSVTNPFVNPTNWLVGFVGTAILILHILIPATSQVLRRRWHVDVASPAGLTLALAVLFASTLVIKSLGYYWMFPVPFLSVLAVAEFQDWFGLRATEPGESRERQAGA